MLAVGAIIISPILVNLVIDRFLHRDYYLLSPFCQSRIHIIVLKRGFALADKSHLAFSKIGKESSHVGIQIIQASAVNIVTG